MSVSEIAGVPAKAETTVELPRGSFSAKEADHGVEFVVYPHGLTGDSVWYLTFLIAGVFMVLTTITYAPHGFYTFDNWPDPFGFFFEGEWGWYQLIVSGPFYTILYPIMVALAFVAFVPISYAIRSRRVRRFVVSSRGVERDGRVVVAASELRSFAAVPPPAFPDGVVHKRTIFLPGSTHSLATAATMPAMFGTLTAEGATNAARAAGAAVGAHNNLYKWQVATEAEDGRREVIVEWVNEDLAVQIADAASRAASGERPAPGGQWSHVGPTYWTTTRITVTALIAGPLGAWFTWRAFLVLVAG